MSSKRMTHKPDTKTHVAIVLTGDAVADAANATDALDYCRMHLWLGPRTAWQALRGVVSQHGHTYKGATKTTVTGPGVYKLHCAECLVAIRVRVLALDFCLKKGST
jgi:hypothetical protein